MMPWQAAVEARRDDAASLSLVSDAFEASCQELAATESGRAVAVRLRAVAVEAWCDAAGNAEAGDARRFLTLAREQVRRAEELAPGDEQLTAAVRAMQATVEHAERPERGAE